MTKGVWTKKEIKLLEAFYGKVSNDKLSSIIGRTKQAVQHKAHRLGLTTKFVAQYKYCLDCGKKLSRASI